LASPTTSAVIINGVTPPPPAAPAAGARVLLGIVSTLAGSSQGFADGTGAGASFSNPFGVAALSNGTIVVADHANSRIRLVTPGGVVTTLAGSGTAAFANGTGTAASFNLPTGVAVTSTGDIVVADYSNHRIRLVTQAGVVTTLAGSGTAAFANGTGAGASFNFPFGVAVTSTGNIVVADTSNHRIRLVTPAGVVTTLAGSGSPAFANGTGADASFYNPSGVAVTSTGNIVVADQGNHRIRLVTPAGVVTTLAGSGTGAFANGTGAGASFYLPAGVAVTSTGDIVVADQANNRIRLVTPGGVVTTLAGSGAGEFANGTGVAASFSNPVGVAVTPTGDVVVGDQTNQRIRVIV
jgi:serine/threonine-protein kinase